MAKVFKFRRGSTDTDTKFTSFVPARGEPVYDEKNNNLYVGSKDNKPIKDLKPIGYIKPGTYLNKVTVNGVKVDLSKGLDINIPNFEMFELPLGLSIGDTDGNGILDEQDFILLKKKHFNNLGEGDLYNIERLCGSSIDVNKVFDIDGDGDLDSTDYVLLKRACLGTYNTFEPRNLFNLENKKEGWKSTAYPYEWDSKGVVTKSLSGVSYTIGVKSKPGAPLIVILSEGLSGAKIIRKDKNGENTELTIWRQMCPTNKTVVCVVSNINMKGYINNIESKNAPNVYVF